MSNTKSPDSADDPDVGVSNVDVEASRSSDSDSDTDALAATTATGTNWAGMRIIAVVAAVIVVLDQLTKIWAVSALTDRDIDLFWTARFNLTYNFGSAFGLGSQLGRWLGLLVVAVVIAVLLYARQMTDRRMLLLFGGIAGGAIGNLIDRIVRAENGFMSGGVVDFIDFQWWPIFNIADIAVVTSAIGLMLISLREPT